VDYDDKIVVFGIQGFIKSWLIDEWNRDFFSRPKEEVVGEYRRLLVNALGPNAADTSHVEALHDLGYLPIMIKALPEGSRVNSRVPVMTIVNTDPRFFWLTNYLETQISASLWLPMTSATTAYEYRRIMDLYAEKTGANTAIIPFLGHDFSYRGMACEQAAAMSGAAHLLSFVGTDTVPAIPYLEKYYGANSDKELIGCSVPATEHSVCTAYGPENEMELFRHLIEDVYPSGVVSIVSDSFDYWGVLTKILPALKDKIEARTPDALGNAKVVIRPDSGDPVRIICGYRIVKFKTRSDLYEDYCWADHFEAVYIEDENAYYLADLAPPLSNYSFMVNQIYFTEIERHVAIGSIRVLYEIFGGTKNEKGYIDLNPRIGLIYGDSITIQRAEEILERLSEMSFTSTNVVFGIGSYTYQHVTRDTLGFAVKATWCQINGEGREIFKDPKTDSGSKKSAKGLLCVERQGDDYVLIDQVSSDREASGELRVVFQDGVLMNEQTLSQIRQRLLG
jgi:nicotinamide phosphoribosyltransferase